MNVELIHVDDRGEILSLTGDGLGHPEIAILITSKGRARGGCIHRKHDEYSTVISGKVRYRIGEDFMDLVTGRSVLIPKGTPHYFIALEDSVVLEWGAEPEEKLEKHTQFREIVERHNDTANNTTDR